ncbi:hypothetical protein ABT009_30485 [Streptomyces sp. NPDC002896]|uniref:hypothetical protein n=1 Tax=Streptomyces sp. NPDC002896 TaxID=3154438 RepID=UPI0033346300
MTTIDTPLCGARRPGWERPGPGRHRHLPCILAEGHDGDHRDAFRQTWHQRPRLTECGALPPVPPGPACWRTTGHDGPHRNSTDREWPEACEACESTAGPLATVTTEASGSVEHWQLCQQCARGGGAPVARRPLRMCVRCDALTDTPVLVSEVHQGSGPGFNVYACPDCAPHYPPLLDVFSLLPPARRAERGER